MTTNYPATQNPTHAWKLMRAQAKCRVGRPTEAEFACVKELHAAIDAHPALPKAHGLRGSVAGAAYCKARASGLRPYAANVSGCWALLAALDKLMQPS